jgi:uncharacterized protein
MAKNQMESRREFLQKLIASTAVLGMAPFIGQFDGKAATQAAAGKMARRMLGKTGHMVPLFSLGGQGSLEIPGKEDISQEIITRALDLGVNYLDTAAAYGRVIPGVTREEALGTSERNLGRILKTRRDEVFLATKTHNRTYDGSMRLLEQSLKNLQTDHIDLWQIHNVRSAEITNIDKWFAEDGVVKAMIKARDEKIIKYIGYTGHEGPDVLNALNSRFDFDNVLVAINAADKHHDPFIEKYLPNAVKSNLGIVGMKIPARDRMFANGGILTMKEAMGYVLTLPVSTVVIGIDNLRELEENISIAEGFKPFTADQMLAIEEKTKPHYKDLLFFKNLSAWPTDW